jgi:hypothetical protein
MSDHLPPQGNPAYHDPTAEPWTVSFHRRRDRNAEQRDGWHDQAPAPGGLQGFTPEGEAAEAWDSDEVFVPRPRAPVDGPAPVTAHLRPSGHRRARRPLTAWPHVLGSLFGVLMALTATAVCLLGWTFSYGPLRDIALTRAPHELSPLWPVIVDGPWLAGCLSVLRAALQGRRPVHSWIVVVVFTGLSAGLCVADVPRTVCDIIVAGLPPVTAGVCVHQLTRQLTSRPSPGRAFVRKAGHRAPH